MPQSKTIVPYLLTFAVFGTTPTYTRCQEGRQAQGMSLTKEADTGL